VRGGHGNSLQSSFLLLNSNFFNLGGKLLREKCCTIILQQGIAQCGEFEIALTSMEHPKQWRKIFLGTPVFGTPPG